MGRIKNDLSFCLSLLQIIYITYTTKLVKIQHTLDVNTEGQFMCVSYLGKLSSNTGSPNECLCILLTTHLHYSVQEAGQTF